MKYYLLNGRENENAPQGIDFQETLDAHHAYTDKYFADGTILLGGPKAAGCGFMIVKAETEEEVREFVANDPFVKSGMQDYDIIEFFMFGCQEPVKEWFK